MATDALSTVSSASPAAAGVPPVSASRVVRTLRTEGGGLMRTTSSVNCGEDATWITEQAIYEVEDRNANLVRRQIFVRDVKRPTGAQLFKGWLHVLLVLVVTTVSSVLLKNLYTLIVDAVEGLHLNEADDLLRSAEVAQRQFELNMCHEDPPPVDLVDQCLRLDQLRHRAPERLAKLVSFAKLVRLMAASLVGDTSYTALVLTAATIVLLAACSRHYK